MREGKGERGRGRGGGGGMRDEGHVISDKGCGVWEEGGDEK